MARYIDADKINERIAEKEELARQRVIDTPSRLSNGDFNPYAIRYATQLDERTTFKFMIADAPTADVDYERGFIEGYTKAESDIFHGGEYAPVKHGHWIVDKSGYPSIICSECSVKIPMVAGWCMDAHINYCPNCGAKMDEEAQP